MNDTDFAKNVMSDMKISCKRFKPLKNLWLAARTSHLLYYLIFHYNESADANNEWVGYGMIQGV